MDKFCLNWNGCDANMRECLRHLREDKRLSDVTLVSDDGQHIQGHKIILSAGSNFFADIFMKSNHNNMLVYLKGISSYKLEPVIDFIYNGEVFITQEQLKVFIETGKELQVKGLEGELMGVAENTAHNQIYHKEREQRYDDYEDKKAFTDTGDKDYDTVANNYDTLARIDEGNLQVNANNELRQQINEIIEKNEGVWVCKICGKTASRNSGIRKHAEIHLEGMVHTCHICSKTFQNRNCLNTHISDIHSKSFSCDICGKTGMNRMSYRNHKQGCNASV